MGTTTHVSAGRRRRQRLRRTLLVTALLVASAATAGYAAWHGDDGDHTSAAARPIEQRTCRGSLRHAGEAVARHSRRPKVSSTSSAAKNKAKGSAANGFQPVVTDRIPAPTTSLALSAAVPGTTNMQAPAAAAFKRAFADARADGLTPEIRSAWRSEQWQQILFDRAVAEVRLTRRGVEVGARAAEVGPRQGLRGRRPPPGGGDVAAGARRGLRHLSHL